MRFYETTIVLSPQSDDAAIGHEIDKITQTITAESGRLVGTQKWGVKRMAYPIQKHSQGQYIHFVYQAPPSVPGKLESAFRINENILRHLTVLVEGPLSMGRGEPVAASEEQAPEAKSAEKPAAAEPKTEPAEAAEPVAEAVADTAVATETAPEETTDEEK